MTKWSYSFVFALTRDDFLWRPTPLLCHSLLLLCYTTGYCQFGNRSAQLMGNDRKDEEKKGKTLQYKMRWSNDLLDSNWAVVSTLGIQNGFFFDEACTKLTSEFFFLLFFHSFVVLIRCKSLAAETSTTRECVWTSYITFLRDEARE